jgi:hypothetical protein
LNDPEKGIHFILDAKHAMTTDLPQSPADTQPIPADSNHPLRLWHRRWILAVLV